MKTALYISLSLIGWLVVFFINRYFHKKNNLNALKNKISEELDVISNLANDFWVNERVKSTHGDYLKLVYSFKKCRLLLSGIKDKEKEEAIKLLNEAKKHLTSTPKDMKSFDLIKKSSVLAVKKYQYGLELLEELRLLVSPF